MLLLAEITADADADGDAVAALLPLSFCCCATFAFQISAAARFSPAASSREARRRTRGSARKLPSAQVMSARCRATQGAEV